MRMRLGLFDPVADQPYEKYGPAVVGSAAHHALSAAASRAGMTLYKNVPLAGDPHGTDLFSFFPFFPFFPFF